MDKENDEIYILGKYCVDHNITKEDIQEISKEVSKRKIKKMEDADCHFQKFLQFEEAKIHTGDLKIDFHAGTLKKGNEVRNIHEQELLILQLLVSNPKETIRDEEILHVLKEYKYFVSHKSLVVYLSRLSHIVGKTPIEEDYIKRHWKKGYYWNYRISKK